MVASIGGNATEDQVWCPKLPVKMHEDFQLQNEVQVFYMNGVEVQFEALGNCIINQKQGQYKWKLAKNLICWITSIAEEKKNYVYIYIYDEMHKRKG